MLLAQAARQSESAPLFLDAAELLIQESAFDEALAAIAQARSIDPEGTRAVLLFAQILLARGEREKAIEELTKFTAARGPRKSQNLEHVYREMAKMHLANDDLVEAFEALSRAHRINSADPEVAFLLGLVAIDLDQLDAAGPALRAFIATKGHVLKVEGVDQPTPISRAYFHLAFIEHVRGNDTAARRMASRSVEESSHNRDAQRLLDELSAS